MPPQSNFLVELPAGGHLHLMDASEVELWNKSHKRYVEDYHLDKTNDLVILGGLLTQQILQFRAQQKISGLEPEIQNGVPTGRYVPVNLDADQTRQFQNTLLEASKEITRLEKALGIDKVSREAGGTVSVEDYLRNLKRAAHERGIHLSERYIAYEAFVNELRWRIRVLDNADGEDKAYHDITPETVIAWANDQLMGLAQKDKEYGHHHAKLFVGKL